MSTAQMAASSANAPIICAREKRMMNRKLGEENDEVGTMNDELKAVAFQFIIHRSSFIVY
jgi:hypothetical protein